MKLMMLIAEKDDDGFVQLEAFNQGAGVTTGLQLTQLCTSLNTALNVNKYLKNEINIIFTHLCTFLHINFALMKKALTRCSCFFDSYLNKVAKQKYSCKAKIKLHLLDCVFGAQK